MFPSPQGGSETLMLALYLIFFFVVSIPSRRVGDLSCLITFTPLKSCFHPLKAGRRLACLFAFAFRYVGFHPLKAGRRLERSPDTLVGAPVSIPSRRVGDIAWEAVALAAWRVSIPSRRVGDAFVVACFTFCCAVSIPSRRVGDLDLKRLASFEWLCFHPLKAGRRLVCYSFRVVGVSSFPSPQGGSETLISQFSNNFINRFHPLKAGRRLFD